jgi:hypothetical protein
MATQENKILISYTAMDEAFMQGTLMYVAGREDASKGNLGTIVLPKPAEDVSIATDLPDPVVFSYSNTDGNIIRLREVLVKMKRTAPGQPSSCTLTVLAPVVDDNWVSMTKDVTLVVKPPSGGSQTDPVPALRNPHGLAQCGSKLCFVDFENQHVVIVEKDLLENAAQGDELAVEVLDLEADLDDENAKGQAIIALGGKVFVLFLSTDLLTATEHGPSQLLRLGLDLNGNLSYEAKIRVGVNAQSIIPVTRTEKDTEGKDVEVVYLLIPAIGGEQYYTGVTNGTNSNICKVKAFEDWSTYPNGRAPIAVTGDPMPTTAGDPLTAYDIHAIGAAMRDGASSMFILTQIYNDTAKLALWRLYETMVEDFLTIPDGTTLSGAVAITTGIEFEVLDSGSAAAPDIQFADDIYFWDIIYEQTPRATDDEDRLWLFQGSPIMVTKAEAYGSPTLQEPNKSPFAMFSGFGGINVNAVDLTIETLHQARREVSLKRGGRASKISAGATKAGVGTISTASVAAEEGEEE